MTTVLFSGEGSEKLFELITKLLEDYDLALSSDRVTGEMSVPSKQKKRYQTLPFGLATSTFTEEGILEFWKPENPALGLFFYPKGALDFSDKPVKGGS